MPELVPARIRREAQGTDEAGAEPARARRKAFWVLFRREKGLAGRRSVKALPQPSLDYGLHANPTAQRHPDLERVDRASGGVQTPATTARLIALFSMHRLHEKRWHPMNCGSCPVCGAKRRLFRSFASGTGQFDLHGKRWYQFAPEIEQCRTCRTRLVPMRETRPWARTLIVSAILLFIAGKLLPAFFLGSSTHLRTISMITTIVACATLAIPICKRRYAPMATGDDKRPGSAATRP